MARNVLGAATFPAGVAVGVGVGGAVGAALEPKLQALKNEAWQRFPELPPAYEMLAEGVAQGQVDPAWAQARAVEQGISADAFNRLVDIANSGPGVGLAFQLWRRDLIDDAAFGRALKREGIENEWIGPLRELKRVLLSPAELANAVVQGHRSQGAATPDAERQGLTAADFDTMVENTGLPPGPETLLEWRRRGIIDDAGLDQGIREGHTKVKYIDEYHAALTRLLTAQEWAGLWLRGHATEAEAKAGGAAVGYTAADVERMYLNRGRPATTRQIHIGYARGGSVPGTAGERDAFDKGVRQSNIRTEYADVLWAQRHTYPSAFVLRALAQDGTFTEAETRQILIESGWRPDYADTVAAKWAGATTAGPGQKWADRARSRVFTEAWSDFLDGNADEGDFRALLQAVGATGAEQDTIVTLANLERGRTRRDLTQAQILKLYRRAIWPREQALAALVDMGMDSGDAADLLDTVAP